MRWILLTGSFWSITLLATAVVQTIETSILHECDGYIFKKKIPIWYTRIKK